MGIPEILNDWFIKLTQNQVEQELIEYQGSVLADFHDRSASAETVKMCNLNELLKIDPSQLPYNDLLKSINVLDLEKQNQHLT